MKRMSVILPAFNEEKEIQQTLTEVASFLKKNKGYEFIFVNDGSRDNTSQIIASFIKKNKVPEMRLLGYPKNKGKGNAIKTGIFSSDAELVSFLDSDLAYSPDHLEGIREELEKNQVVIGSRKLFKDNFRRTKLSRVIIGKTFNFLVRSFLGLNYPDTQAGIKGFRRESAEKIFRNQSIKGWGFDIEVLFLAKKNGYKIKEIPVKLSERHINRTSKVSVVRDSINMFGDLFKIRLNSLLGKYEK
jgi:dolichyl-phosphate beta-glucosyltransferase